MLKSVLQKHPRLTRRISVTALVCIGLLGALPFVAPLSCDDTTRDSRSRAYRISSRTELIGGPTALGEVGDYMLENDQIRLIVQNLDYNRGSGLFGGSLIDADLARPVAEGTAFGGNGVDTFGELFPAFFLEVIDPEEIEILNDGSNGEAAVLEVRGRGGEFITMLRLFNQVMVNAYEPQISDLLNGIPANSDGEPQVRFSTRYILEPGARHVRIESELANDSFKVLDFPNQSILGLLTSFLGLDLSGFSVPVGHVLGFGALNQIFLPEIGYDLRFGLEERYQEGFSLPAFPGQLTPFVASTNRMGVNYGFATAPNPEANFVYQKDQPVGDGEYACCFNFDEEGACLATEPCYRGQAEPDDLLFLFSAAGFGGVFSHQIPERLAPSFCNEEPAEVRCEAIFSTCEGELCEQQEQNCERQYPACQKSQGMHPTSFTFTSYFFVGDGDVSSILDELYKVREVKTQRVEGRIVDAFTAQPVGLNESLLIYKVDTGATQHAAACQKADPNSRSPEAPLYSQVFTNWDGFFHMDLPPGRYCYRTAGRLDGRRQLGRSTPFEVPEDRGIFLEATAPQNAVIEADVVDQHGQLIPAKLTVVGTHDLHDNPTKRQWLFDLRAGEPWRTSDMEEDTSDPSTRRYIETVALGSSNGRIRTQVRPGQYTLYFSRGPEYELSRQEVDIQPGDVLRVQGLLRRTVDSSGYLSGDFHMHAQGSIDSGLDYNLRVNSIAAEGVEVVVSTDHNYISDYAPFIVSQGLEPWLQSVIGVELTTFEAGHFNAFPMRYDVSSPSRGSFRWQDIPPDLLFDELRARGEFGQDTIVQVNHPRDAILGYFTQYNLDPFTGEVELEINTATGTDRLIAAASSPTGDAFMRFNENTDRFESAFSWNFDAIEIFNGKRFELLRHFRLSKDQLRPLLVQRYEAEFLESGDDQATASEKAREKADQDLASMPDRPIVCDGDEVLWPGGLDDWYNLLNRPPADPDSGAFRYFTATGNSDSHTAGSAVAELPGYPRNFFYVGHDDPLRMARTELIEAIGKNRRNIVTNGPLVELFVNDAPIGETVSTSGADVSVTIRVRAASWVGADRYRLLANGEVVKEGPISLQEHAWETTFTVPTNEDTWFVVEVEGDQNLFPVVPPQEEPPFNFADIVGELAGPFGFGATAGLTPPLTFQVRPFAFTNPVFVDADGDGAFTPPMTEPARCEDGIYQPGALLSPDALDGALRTPNARLNSISMPEKQPNPVDFLHRDKSEKRDVRMIFEAWGSHQH